MFKELVLAIEGNERDVSAAPLAARLARQMDLPLRLLSVVAEEAETEARRDRLNAALEGLESGDAAIEVLADGDVSRRLVREMRQRPEVLGCMPTHARAAVGEAVMGSVAGAVMRETGVPVVLVGPGYAAAEAGRIENLLVCLDTSPLSEAILPVAAEFARRGGITLWLVEVIDPATRGGAHGGADVAGEASYVHQESDRLRREHGVKAGWEVLHGNDPARALVDYARGLSGAMIALTTHGRSGLSEILAGSVARQIIRSAPCPVLVVRPEE